MMAMRWTVTIYCGMYAIHAKAQGLDSCIVEVAGTDLGPCCILLKVGDESQNQGEVCDCQALLSLSE